MTKFQFHIHNVRSKQKEQLTEAKVCLFLCHEGRFAELTINSVKSETACLGEVVRPLKLFRCSLALFIHSAIAEESRR